MFAVGSWIYGETLKAVALTAVAAVAAASLFPLWRKIASKEPAAAK